MADLLKIFKICPVCQGTGITYTSLVTPDPQDGDSGVTEMTCVRCSGTGEIEWGRMEEMAVD